VEKEKEYKQQINKPNKEIVEKEKEYKGSFLF
jgi:hypothetical protein